MATRKTAPRRKPERAKVKRTASGALAASARKKSATIVQHKAGPKGGTTRHRFPMPDREHARLALAFVDRAKGLTPAERAEVKARAHRILGDGK